MKTFAVMVLVACVLPLCFGCKPAQKTQPPQSAPPLPSEVSVVDGIQLVIAMSHDEYTASEPVGMDVELSNLNDKEKAVYVLNQHFLAYYSEVTIKDANGNDVARKEPLPQYSGEPAHKHCMLQPDEPLVRGYDLRKLYDLPIGKYTLRLHAKIPFGYNTGEYGEFTSNEIAFRIIPDPPQSEPATIAENVEMSIRMRKDKYLADEPIDFAVLLTNKGNQELADKRIYASPHIVANDGKEVPLEKRDAAYPRGLDMHAEKVDAVIPRSGQSGLSWNQNLRWYAALPPGRYTFTLDVDVDGGKSSSNAVTFEVVNEKIVLPDAPVHNNVQVIVQMTKRTYHANDGIGLRIFIRNVDPEKTLWVMKWEMGEYLIYQSKGRLLDANGKEMPWNPQINIALFGNVPIRPGEISTFGAGIPTLDRLPAGDYTFKLIGTDRTIGEYESNEVKFTVEPPLKTRPIRIPGD